MEFRSSYDGYVFIKNLLLPPDEYMFSSKDMITFMSDDMVIGVLLDNSVGLVCELVSCSLP